MRQSQNASIDGSNRKCECRPDKREFASQRGQHEGIRKLTEQLVDRDLELWKEGAAV